MGRGLEPPPATIPVYAVAAGVVPETYGGLADPKHLWGEVLIEHTYQGDTWWSGYLHMEGIQAKPGDHVTTDTVLGYISNESTSEMEPHLHFVVYGGANKLGELVSFDAVITERNAGTVGQGPAVEDVSPGSGKQTQGLTVTISGANFDGATDVGFGSGITVEDFSVNSSTEITAEITIDASAAKGMRDVSVTTGYGTATKTGGFEVVGSGGGICGGGAPVAPGAPSEMTTVLAALAVLLGVGYYFVRRGAKNGVRV